MRIRIIPRKNRNSGKRLRVCAYARVSTATEEQEDSLVNQTAYYQQLISDNPAWEFAGVYSDEGITGYKENRPGFQQMLQDARRGKFDMVLVKSISRFARNTYTLLDATRELKALGISVFFELQNIDTLSASGELMLTITGAFAQAESESASQGARMMYRHKFAQQIRTAASERTYGFCADRAGNLCVKEDEAQVVRLMFDLAARGVWASKIKAYLNKNNIPAPKGGKWDDTGVARVLRNEMYKGDLVLQKTVKDSRRISHPNRGEQDQCYIKHNHDAIVPPDLWDEVQAVLAQRREHLDNPLPPPPSQPRSCRTHYPMTGKLFCPYCGERLIHKWSNGRREYWACKTNIKVSAAACKGIWLPAEVTLAWGEFDEPVTVIPYDDEFGMHRFTALPKDEYEAFSECQYGKEDDLCQE